MTEPKNRREADGEIAKLRQEVAELKLAVSDLVDAWKAARGFLSLIKWSAGLGAALAVILGYLHGGAPK